MGKVIRKGVAPSDDPIYKEGWSVSVLPKKATGVVKARLTRVTFSELHEVVGAFGREWIAPAGGGFPKHLVYSYDIKTKTVVFPIGWVIRSENCR